MITPVANQTTGSGIVIPEERSIKQRNYAYCSNPACAVDGHDFYFEVEHSSFCCPKCGANQPPLVGMLAKIHLLVADPRGQFPGVGGLRYRVACDSKVQRNVISTEHNHEVGTGDLSVCNCIDCLAEAKKLNAPAQIGALIR